MLPISLVHLLYHSSEEPDAAIITPATIIAINEASKITVTNILVSQSMSKGNAFLSVA
jgi:hypothetical protein